MFKQQKFSSSYFHQKINRWVIKKSDTKAKFFSGYPKTSIHLKIMSVIFVILVISLLPNINGYFSSYNSWEFMFPMDVMSEIYSIENNESLSLIGKEKSIDAIVSKQIDYSQKNKLQLPSIFTGLPAVAQWQIKDVFCHPNLTFEEKQTIIESLISKLPMDEQIIPPKDKCRNGISREKSMFFDTYSTLVYSIRYTIPLTELKEKLSEEEFDKIFETLENKTLSMKQKLKEVSENLNNLDPDVQQRLFQLNGPMDVEPFQNKLLSKFREELKNAAKKVPTTAETSTVELAPTVTSTMATIKKKAVIFGTKIESNLNFAKLKKLMG